MIYFKFLKKNDFLSKYKFCFLCAIIFIFFTVIHYKFFSYGSYNDHWGPDQASIERIANYLISGLPLTKEIWKHGLGYPILIAPFLIFPNPFNASGFLFFITNTTIILKNIEVSIKEEKKKYVFLILVLLSFTLSPDMRFWVMGGSNIVSAILILLSILWSISPSVPYTLPIILGVLSGIVFSTRYVDYILLFPLYISAILNYSRIYKKRFLINLFVVCLISSIFLVLTLITHKIFLGGFFITPYNSHVIDSARLVNLSKTDGLLDQFNNRYFEWIIPNLYSTLISYKTFASELTVKGAKTALSISPILIFAPYSIVNYINFLLNNKQNKLISKLKIASLCSASSLIIWFLFYASRWASTAHDLYWYSLRFYMGWITLIMFLTLYGLILKPKFKTFLISALIYVLIFAYPSYFQKSQFEKVNIISQIEVLDKKNKNSNDIFNLPIPFDKGSKSILAITKDKLVLGVDNYSSNLFLGTCSFKNFNVKTFKNNFKSCTYFESRVKYEPENGMKFLSLKKSNDNYEIYYEVVENNILMNKKFLLLKSNLSIENEGSVELILNKKKEYKVKDQNNKEFFIKRNNKNYFWNDLNLYYPKWPLVAADNIESKNQILTINKEDKVYCIWQLDKKWNFKKDRLCAQFSDNELLQHEDEFQIDINQDGYLANSKIEQKKYLNKKFSSAESKFTYNVDPLNLELNKVRFFLSEHNDKSKNIELNIFLKNTGNAVYNTFPKRISIECNSDENACEAYKIGRFNNQWKIWIRPKKMIKYIDINILKKGKEYPIYWPISYITTKN